MPRDCFSKLKARREGPWSTQTGVFSESKAGRVGWGSGGISTATASIRRILASS